MITTIHSGILQFACAIAIIICVSDALTTVRPSFSHHTISRKQLSCATTAFSRSQHVQESRHLNRCHMTSKSTSTKLLASTSASNLFKKFFRQPSGVSLSYMEQMIQRRYGKQINSKESLVVVVTGATGGIGSSIVETLWRVKDFMTMGMIIFMVDYDEKALEELKSKVLLQQSSSEETRQQFTSKPVNDANDNVSRIETIVADFSDLESVADGAEKILGLVEHQTIGILVNNAGIAYSFADSDTGTAKKSPPISKQGYDLLFQINYLSHFLWTEKLVPKLSSGDHTGRVVSIASGFHWGADGNDLKRSISSTSSSANSLDTPYAACALSDESLQAGQAFAASRAYSNSKLAQIWQMAYLNCKTQRKLAISCCPSWAATSIGGNDESKEFLAKFAFPTHATKDDLREGRDIIVAGPAMRSILNAMFLPADEMDPQIWKGESFLGNSDILDRLLPKSKNGQSNHFLFSDWVNRNLMRRADFSRNFACFVILLFQRWFYKDEVFFQATSVESRDLEGQATLHDWSTQAIAQWLVQNGTTEEADNIAKWRMEEEANSGNPPVVF